MNLFEQRKKEIQDRIDSGKDLWRKGLLSETIVSMAEQDLIAHLREGSDNFHRRINANREKFHRG